MTELLWWVFASLTFVGALGMVIGKTPIASLLFLVVSFFGLAAIYVLLGAHFIGAVQVIVYAGAIMVLFLFVIMLLNLGLQFRSDLREAGWLVAGSVASGTIIGVLGFVLWRAFGRDAELVGEQTAAMIDASVAEVGAVGAIAFPLFRDFLVAFELTSVLLLVAIIGAVLLAKRRV